MEHLSVQQPCADALCSGLFEGWPLDEAPQSTPCKYMVYATRQVFNPQTPLELLAKIHNEQVFGNLGETDTLPVDVYVGYVILGEPISPEKRWWRYGITKPVYRVLEARLFDVAYCPDHMGIFLPLDKWLPTSIVHIARPSKEGNLLTLPASEKIFSRAGKYGTFFLDLTPEMCKLVLEDEDDEDDARVIKELRLVCGHRMKRFNVLGGIDIFYELDDQENPIFYPSIMVPDSKQMRGLVRFKCEHQLI